MKPLSLWVGLLLAAAPMVRAADAPGVTFYVQLIRGSDQDAPPEPQAHLIGPKLDNRLRNIFKWKNYWEIKRESVALKSGATVRRRMSPQREVEISWTGARNISVSIYKDGELTRRRLQTIDTNFYIAGGDKDATDSWFIIVRKDNPDESASASTKLAGPL